MAGYSVNPVGSNGGHSSVNITESRFFVSDSCQTRLSAVSSDALFHCRRNGRDRTENVGHEIAWNIMCSTGLCCIYGKRMKNQDSSASLCHYYCHIDVWNGLYILLAFAMPSETSTKNNIRNRYNSVTYEIILWRFAVRSHLYNKLYTRTFLHNCLSTIHL